MSSFWPFIASLKMLRLFIGTFCKISRSMKGICSGEELKSVCFSRTVVGVGRGHFHQTPGAVSIVHLQMCKSMCRKLHYMKNLPLKESIHTVTLTVKTTNQGMILKTIIINQKNVKSHIYIILFYGQPLFFILGTLM